MSNVKFALAGNPNSGKTTLFNALTGARQYVGNWPGVTVEKKEGKVLHNNKEAQVIDLPGTYSLSPYSIEEIIARDCIVDESPDVVINIVDASNLERNLYLSTQLIEMGRPVVIALNMMDVASRRGYKIDCDKLSSLMGVPVVPIVASKKDGIDKLLNIAFDIAKDSLTFKSTQIAYGQTIEKEIENLGQKINDSNILKKYNKRWLALKIMENDEKVLDLLSLKESFNEYEELEFEITDKKYEFIGEIIANSVVKPKDEGLTLSDKIDRIITNKLLGIPMFAAIMMFVFYFTFDVVGNKMLDAIDGFFADTLTPMASDFLVSIGTAPWLQSLIVDGIIGGVGGVLVFLPNIVCLFLAITILEDSGYMARVAFIMDRAMNKIGLNGKAFVPMILGFGCNAPAIMGTRTLENEKDRLVAILINPFMSCAARLPVYTLFAAAFFKGSEKIVVTSLYFLGIFVAIIVGLIFKKTLFKSDSMPFVMELPPYRIPTFKNVFLRVWDRAKGFLIKAGTLIFAASMVLWFILGFNFSGQSEMVNSFGASIGGFLAPIFAPLGFGNWQASLSLLTGLLAKEVVVANMSIIYGLAEEPSAAAFAQTLSATFTQLSAYAFMVFVLLYTPCLAVIGVIKRETNSWKWTGFSVAYQFFVAWLVALIVYQGGLLLGF